MHPTDNDKLVDQIRRAGFVITVRSTVTSDGMSCHHLSGRSPCGAFFVSARTEGEAFRAALDQVGCFAVPEGSTSRGG